MKFIVIILLVIVPMVYSKDYTKDAEALEFIQMMHKKHEFKLAYLKKLFSDVTRQEVPLSIITGKPLKNPPKTVRYQYPKGAWDRYVYYKVTPKRIQQGLSFIKKYQSTFKHVEKKYGVPTEYIAAIIGIESVYGINVGKHPVFDTLTTLAFEENRRNKFFQRELEKFILLSYRQKFNPKNVMGSYTGAIGLGQFMPSNYEAYGIDFNKDGKISLQHPQDAIASVANYLKQNGWRRGEEVATRVAYEGNRFKALQTGYMYTYNRADLIGIKPKYGKWDYNNKVRLIKLDRANYDELWYGAKNFYVITRYNQSAYYAMSVHQLAKRIKKGS